MLCKLMHYSFINSVIYENFISTESRKTKTKSIIR